MIASVCQLADRIRRLGRWSCRCMWLARCGKDDRLRLPACCSRVRRLGRSVPESGDSADGLVDACRCQDVVRCSPLFASLLIPSQETRRTDLSTRAAVKMWEGCSPLFAILWVSVTVNRLREELFAVAIAAERQMSGFNLQIAANTAWASATVNLMHEKLFAALEIAAERRRSGRANSRGSPLTAERPRVCGGIGLEGLATPIRAWWHCPLCVCGGIALYACGWSLRRVPLSR